MADNEPETLSPRQTLLPGALMVAGILLLLVSAFWPGKAVSRAAWSPEQANAYQAASVKLHSLSQQSVASAGSNDEQALREKLANAEAEYKTIRTQLDAAIDRPKHLTLILRICGSLLAIVGLLMINKQSNK
jgi:hypothetical protein